jgi:ABC-type antimicrobial peptide transport system permease subunit
MFINNFKSGIRNLLTNKSITAINILGLSLGLSAFILILLWVENEYSYNSKIKDKDHISSLMINQRFESGEIQTYPATPPPLAKKLMESVKGVNVATTTSWGDQVQIAFEDIKFTEYGLYVSPEFLNVFSVEIVSGTKVNILSKPNTIIISENLASKYFGNVTPMGKILKIGNSADYEVVGVMKDGDKKNTMRYSFLMPIADYYSFNPYVANDWSSNNVRTYVKLDPGVDHNAINTDIKTLLHQQNEKQKNCDLFLWPMKDWHLKGEFKDGKQIGGRIKYVHLFSVIGLVILMLSCINFVNLTTAGATQRLKEIGVRKSLGADKWALIKYFLMESFTLALISGGLSIGILYVIMPMFNANFDLDLSLSMGDPVRLIQFIGIILLSGFLAGIYPAFVLSGIGSVTALKKNPPYGLGNTAVIRKALVTAQFAVTILLISAAYIVTKQLDYFQSKDLGIEKENLVWFPNQIPYDKVSSAMEEITKINGVQAAALSSMTFQGSNNRGHEVQWPGKKQGDDVFFNFIAGSHDLPASLGLEVIGGRSFSKTITTDTNAVLINESAAKKMNIMDPVGQILNIRGMPYEIVGIVKDFHFESLHNEIGPVIMNCRADWTWLMYVRLDGHKNDVALKSIEKVYQKFAPGQIFEYNYQKDQPHWFYRSEGQTATLIKWFSAFAVFLSCLGLMGLTIFTIERKRKEIGIRKVLGAKTWHLLLILSNQFLFLIAIAVVISLVPAYYFTNDWLNNYAYHIDIEWYFYLFGPIITLFFAFGIMSILIFKASMANPVRSLNME